MSNFGDLIERQFPNATLVDEVESKFILNGYTAQRGMQKAIYFFVDELIMPKVIISGVNDVFHRIANAICVAQINGETLGHFAEFNISTLISSLSNCNNIKASKLYGNPNTTGLAWDVLKVNYLQNKILNKLVVVEQTNSAHSVNWRFANVSDLVILDNEIQLSNALKNYLDNNILNHILRESIKSLK